MTSGLYIRLDGTPVSITFLVLNVIIISTCVLVALLNVIAVITILQKQKWNDFSCVFLMNLAMSDTLLAVAVLYNSSYNLIHFKFFHECVFRYSCINATIFGSAYMLLGLGFDRYIKINFPLRYYNFCSVYTVVIYIAIVWTCAVLLVIVPFATHFMTEHDDSSCGYFTVLNHVVLKVYAFVMFVALFIQLFLNCHLLLIASSKICPTRLRNRRGSLNLQKVWEAKWTWWKPAKTVMIIVGVNILCLVPAGELTLVVIVHSKIE